MTRWLVASGDPGHGYWCVQSTGKMVLWVDASGLALGAVLEINAGVVENVVWLRSSKGVAHINLSELEAAILAINLAQRWDVHQFQLQ